MILDTCFLIDLQREAKRGEEGPAHAFLRHHARERFSISVITALEFLEGFEDPRRAQPLLLPYNRIEVDEITASIGARIRRDLRASGSLIGDFDILIAATAMCRDQILVTDNVDHFARIDGLELLSYRTRGR